MGENERESIPIYIVELNFTSECYKKEKEKKITTKNNNEIKKMKKKRKRESIV